MRPGDIVRGPGEAGKYTGRLALVLAKESSSVLCQVGKCSKVQYNCSEIKKVGTVSLEKKQGIIRGGRLWQPARIYTDGTGASFRTDVLVRDEQGTRLIFDAIDVKLAAFIQVIGGIEGLRP